MAIQKYNQQGMSAILFAMIFTIILSLLAVGFATLVRNDQRQTLDQSLGYQAQYAAETAVNQVAANLKANPTAPANTNCGPSYELITGSGVKVSCVTWDSRAKNIILEQVATEPVTAHIEVPSLYNNLYITWTAANTGTYGSGAFPNQILATNYPVLKAIFLPEDTTDAVSLYFTPVNNGGGTIAYPSVNADGISDAADCDAATGSCTMQVNMGPFNDGYLALSAIGQVASKITIEARQGTTPQDILNSQYVIDATAIAQDVTKRVQARVPYGSQTWRPAFAATADRMCKDIRIDGTNTSSVSGAAVCP
jgi:Tfp pilus assembly protein PilX